MESTKRHTLQSITVSTGGGRRTEAGQARATLVIQTNLSHTLVKAPPRTLPLEESALGALYQRSLIQ
jgi:hypothetical protein